MNKTTVSQKQQQIIEHAESASDDAEQLQVWLNGIVEEAEKGVSLNMALETYVCFGEAEGEITNIADRLASIGRLVSEIECELKEREIALTRTRKSDGADDRQRSHTTARKS